MSWPADLFYAACAAAGVPDASQHTVAQQVALGACLGLVVVAFALVLGGLWVDRHERLHPAGGRPSAKRSV